jgi:ribosomal protein S18 acetylase RimI-like enzyme
LFNVASLLIQRILNECQLDPMIDQVCLHVHVGNKNALDLYLGLGFEIETTLYGYYASNPGVDPPDAFYLRKTLK